MAASAPPPTDAATPPAPPLGATLTGGSPALRALRLREFRLLLGTQFAAGLTQPMLFLAQGWYVSSAAPEGRQVVYLGAVGATRGLAFLSYVLIGGTFADRFPRRRVLIVSQLVSLAMTLGIGALLLLPAIGGGEGAALPLMIVLFASFGLIVGQDGPTRTAMVRDSVPPALLGGAISLFQLVISGALLVAAPLAGWAIDRFGVAPTYLLAALGPATIALIALRLPAGVGAADPGAAAESVIENVRGGLRVLRADHVVRWTVLLTWAVTAAGLSVLGVLVAAWVREVLHLSASGWGLLVLCWGIGSAIASLYLSLRGNFRSKGRLFLGSSLLFGCAVLGFSLSRSVPLAFTFNIIAGAGFMGLTTVGLAIVQSTVPNRLLGRVTGLLLLGGGLMQVLALGVGLVAQVVGLEAVCVAAGVTVIATTLAVAVCQRPLRTLD